jgi:hypothetical protein
VTTVNVPGSFGTDIYGVNAVGQTVGQFNTNTVLLGQTAHGVLRDADGTLTAFDVPGANGTVAHGINDTGEIAGFYVTATGHLHSFLRDSGGSFTLFDVPGSLETVSLGINDAGQIVGYYNSLQTGSHGFLRDSGGGFQTFDLPMCGVALPLGINDSGQITGFSTCGDSFVATASDFLPPSQPGPGSSSPEPSTLLQLSTCLSLFLLKKTAVGLKSAFQSRRSVHLQAGPGAC